MNLIPGRQQFLAERYYGVDFSSDEREQARMARTIAFDSQSLGRVKSTQMGLPRAAAWHPCLTKYVRETREASIEHALPTGAQADDAIASPAR
jgi:hypothetical protein